MATGIGDVGRLFAALADAPSCEHDARGHCRELSARLTAASTSGSDDGAMRVLSSLEGPIADQVQAAAAELGGARELTIVSPYWEASAIDGLMRLLGLSGIRAHVPLASVPAPEGMDWPREAKGVRPVTISHLAVEGAVTRGLHAKIFELVCARGRLVLSGSANATGAGLLHGGATARNVEVCVLRTDRRARARWSVVDAKAPPKPKVAFDGEEDEPKVGVLVAAHLDGGIEGRILTPWKAATATATMEVSRRR